MTKEIGWKKRVFETHEVQVQVRQRTPNAWEYTVRVCRPGTNIRAAGTLLESSKLTDHFATAEAAEVAGFAHGAELAKRLA
ncbi:hypothetical protein P3W85_41930 [Cupriavidus basilensis]|uniref:Uncharacterized protein n=1 Tax=Cupriavidus basilensis TaxID=68895 RepID=A0ABT6B3J2_9BURK|nr:hypothetical protein [Cupriavidus basilensis]MDF3839452.1 hypothetical protein [Cupriavidus basilensis]